MFKQISLLLIFMCIVLVGAGCEATNNTPETPKNAPVLSSSTALVPAETAISAPAEELSDGKAALPCYQFKFREGFQKWIESYEKGDSDTTERAGALGFPEDPEGDFIKALKDSNSEGSLQTSVCAIHKALGIYSWAVEFPTETKVYTYRKPNHEVVTVRMTALNDIGEAYTTTTNLGQMGLPTCLPKTITLSELIWFCGSPYENWKQVHVSRRLGNMVQILCEIERDGEKVPVSAGCLVPKQN
jgi:hypothetical protein